jgi:hypothetical protein
MAYTSDARKAQYLTYREIGLRNSVAAKRSGITRQTRHNIWKRAGQLEIDHVEQDLPPPTIEQTVAIRPKASRPKVLDEFECNAIFAACTVSKEA